MHETVHGILCNRTVDTCTTISVVFDIIVKTVFVHTTFDKVNLCSFSRKTIKLAFCGASGVFRDFLRSCALAFLRESPCIQ